MVRRGIGFTLRWTGIFLCFAVIPSIPILLEGVTGLVGEGERLQSESNDKVRLRLFVVVSLWSVAALGWILARIGTALQRPGSHSPVGLVPLGSEVLWFLGVVGVVVGVLVEVSPRAAGYEPSDAYRRFPRYAAFGGLVALAAGWLVRWLWFRPSRHTGRCAAPDRRGV